MSIPRWTSATRWARFSRLAASSSLRYMPRRTWCDHGERDSAARFVNFDHPYLDDVADRNHVMGIANEPIRQLANVHQAAVVEADIDKGAEIDHVENAAEQFHAGLKIVEF